MLKFTLQSFAVVAIVTVVAGIFGLMYGVLYLSHMPSSEFSDWDIPGGLEDFGAFISAGSMHNASYLGGVIGLLFGVWWQIRSKRLSALAGNAA
jgi:hypothetical protein